MKYLTEEDVRWKPLDEYISAKALLNRKEYTVPWRDKYSRRKSVGPCQDIARGTTAKSYEEFFEYYLDNANRHIEEPINKRGCTLDELEMVAYNWMVESGNPYNLDLKTFFYGVIMHVIIETYMGKLKEIEVMEAFVKCGYGIIESTSDEDADMGIDFKVYDVKGIKWLVQVKPISFVLGCKPDLINDRKFVYAKHTLGHERYPNVPYVYMFYNSKEGGKWIYNTQRNSYFFKYNELIGSNGYPLFNKDEFLSCQKQEIVI